MIQKEKALQECRTSFSFEKDPNRIDHEKLKNHDGYFWSRAFVRFHFNPSSCGSFNKGSEA